MGNVFDLLGTANMGDVYAMIGAGLAVALCCVGAAIGMSIAQRAAAGVVSEDPEKYSKTLILQLIPSAPGLYGFIVGFLVLMNVVMNGGGYTTVQGLTVLAACLPIAIVGLIGTIGQAKVGAACIVMMGKRPELSGRAITMTIFIELFILFGLIISILAVLQVPVG